MRERIAGEEFDEALAAYRTSAFRLEQQPAYLVPDEAGHLPAFLAGNPIAPTEMTEFRRWLDRITERTSAGAIMTRVRVNDVPPTDYQRWCRWVDTYNTAAGEAMHYLTRPTAVAAGIVPALGDWWLLDSSRVILMDFDAVGVLREMTLTDEPHLVDEARRWRDVALKLAAPRPEDAICENHRPATQRAWRCSRAPAHAARLGVPVRKGPRLGRRVGAVEGHAHRARPTGPVARRHRHVGSGVRCGTGDRHRAGDQPPRGSGRAARRLRRLSA